MEYEMLMEVGGEACRISKWGRGFSERILLESTIR